MNDYRAYVDMDYNSIYHYGVKGMRWGVRRYQNYDGNYTQKGLKRFKEASDSYDEWRGKYKKLKSEKADKALIKEAKANMKLHKKDMEKKYKGLKYDKLADEGRELYRQGKTITYNDRVSNTLGGIGKLAGLGAVGLGTYTAQNRHMLSPQVRRKLTYATAGLAGLGLGAHAVGAISRIPANRRNKRLRAYYGHKQA